MKVKANFLSFFTLIFLFGASSVALAETQSHSCHKQKEKKSEPKTETRQQVVAVQVDKAELEAKGEPAKEVAKIVEAGPEVKASEAEEKVAEVEKEVVEQEQEQPPSVEPEEPTQHGPFKGEKECFNFPKKKKNCDCDRECVNGQKGKDYKCMNYCYEDKCKCKTKCDT